MLIRTFTMTAFQQNTRVIACETSRKAICVDPGEPSRELVDFINTNDLQLQAITLTHGHLDHVGGTAALSAEFPSAEIILGEGDNDLYLGLPNQPAFLGIPVGQLKALGLEYDEPPRVTRHWEHGEKYGVGNLEFTALHCPGHTRGHFVLAEVSEKKVFVGDCLFEGSIGRTDLPGGDHDQLLESIEANILSLGDEFIVYPGHGRETTVGRERKTNPFLTGAYHIGKGKYF